MKITENVSISTLTTMRLGGPARYVIEIEQPEDIPEAYHFAKQKHLPTFILGGGANTIGHDEGYDGVIIINRMRGITEENVSWAGDANRGTPKMFSEGKILGDNSRQDPPREAKLIRIKAFGGEPWDNVVAFACERGLTGIEALSKIPGLAGAAPVQNIGAYGQDISQTLHSIEVYDTTDQTFKNFTKADLKFSYRKSILNTSSQNRYFIISITLSLQKGQMSGPYYTSIEDYIKTHQVADFSPQSIRHIVSTIRASKLPDPKVKASSGSFFKNIHLTAAEAKVAENKGIPVYEGNNGFKINSGWLIEQAGLKGKLIHGMRVCDTAALVLINESAKNYADLAAARSEIIDTVAAKFGYSLEQEPVEI